jgi:hypothetical protein
MTAGPSVVLAESGWGDIHAGRAGMCRHAGARRRGMARGRSVRGRVVAVWARTIVNDGAEAVVQRSGGESSRGRERWGGALGGRSFAVAKRPGRRSRGGDNHRVGWLENERSLGVERGADGEGGVAVLLLRGADEFADAAHIVRGEREAGGFADGHGFRVGDEHAAPGEGLDQMPLSPGGEKPREEDDEDLEAAAHLWRAWL